MFVFQVLPNLTKHPNIQTPPPVAPAAYRNGSPKHLYLPANLYLSTASVPLGWWAAAYLQSDLALIAEVAAIDNTKNYKAEQEMIHKCTLENPPKSAAAANIVPRLYIKRCSPSATPATIPAVFSPEHCCQRLDCILLDISRSLLSPSPISVLRSTD